MDPTLLAFAGGILGATALYVAIRHLGRARVRKSDERAGDGQGTTKNDLEKGFNAAIRRRGFHSKEEFLDLVAAVPLNTPGQIMDFKMWQERGGTREELVNLIGPQPAEANDGGTASTGSGTACGLTGRGAIWWG